MEESNNSNKPSGEDTGLPNDTLPKQDIAIKEFTYLESPEYPSSSRKPEEQPSDRQTIATSNPYIPNGRILYSRQQRYTYRHSINNKSRNYNTDHNQTSSCDQQPAGKSYRKLITLIAVILIIIIAAAAVYTFRSQIANSYTRLAESPAEYYAYVEKKTIRQLTGRLKPYLEAASGNVILKSDTDAAIDQETVADQTYVRLGISGEQLLDFLERYSKIIIKQISRVEIRNNADISLNSISVECTELDVTITDTDLINIQKAILKEAKKDRSLISSLFHIELSPKEYKAAINAALRKADTSPSKPPGHEVHMRVYADSSGRIISRELSSDASDTVFGYTFLSRGNRDEFNLYRKNTDKNSITSLTGTQSKKNGACTGNAVLKITGSAKASKSININLDYKDLQTKIIDGLPYQYGSFTITSPAFKGFKITSEYGRADEKQFNKLLFRRDTAPPATINSSLEYLKNDPSEEIPEKAKLYDYLELKSILTAPDLEKYISMLSGKSEIDLKELIDNYWHTNISFIYILYLVSFF